MNTRMARWRALIVDDSPSMRKQLFHALLDLLANGDVRQGRVKTQTGSVITHIRLQLP